jgi:hypothetical protein
MTSACITSRHAPPCGQLQPFAISANFARVVKQSDAAMVLYLCGLDREISVQEQF